MLLARARLFPPSYSLGLGQPHLPQVKLSWRSEPCFIVAASGLAPNAVASVGQAIGAGSIHRAKKQAVAVLRLGIFAGLRFTPLIIGASFFLSVIYPHVGKEVLTIAFWGLFIVGLVQPAKILNGVLGNGIVPSGGDTNFVLLGHLIGSYLLGPPPRFYGGFSHG
jgi:Na+-driven multidrug efflux pump